MKKFLACLLASTGLISTWPAQAGTVPLIVWGKTSVDLPGACADDGHLGAPAGTPQYVSLQLEFIFPPACGVPDVTYNTGADNDCAACTNPETTTFPSEVFWYNFGPHQNSLVCSGGNGTHIHDLDFTKVAGGQGGLVVDDCDNVVVDNLKIAEGCNDPAHRQFGIVQTNRGTNITISKVTIDGGGAGSISCGDDEAITLNGSGAKSVKYVRIVNAIQHNITLGCNTDPCTHVIKYNNFTGTGWGQGQHGNILQILGNSAGMDYGPNLIYAPQPYAALESGMTIDTNGTTTITIHLGADGDQNSILPGMTITAANIPAGTTITSFGGSYPNTPYTAVLSNAATSTVTGEAAGIPNAYPFGTAGVRYGGNSHSSPYLNGIFKGNVYYSTGPIQVTSYAFVCTGGVGQEANITDFSGNYGSPAGYNGGFFFRDAGCVITSATGNKNLSTGATISVP